MSMTPIDRLTLKLLDETISAEEIGELEAALARGDAGAEGHFLLLELEAALRALGPGPDVREATVRQLKEETSARLQQAVLRAIAARPAPGWLAQPDARTGRRLRLRNGLRAVAALAAVLVVAVGLVVTRRGVERGRPGREARVARTPRAAGRVVDGRGRLEVLAPGGESRPALIGQEVAPGQTLRTADDESFAVVELADHTRIDLSSESSVRLMTEPSGAEAGDTRVLLASGVLRADVAPQRAGEALVIVTPVAQIRVPGPGPAALVSTTTRDCTWVDLADGRAEMVRQSDGKRVGVEAGSTATVRAGVAEVVVRPRGERSPAPRRRLAFAPAHTLTFTRDGSTLLAANSRRLLRLSLATGAGEEEVVPIPTPFRDGTRASLAAGGEMLVLTMDDGLAVWDLTWMRRRLALEVDGLQTRPVALAADGSWLAAQDGDPNRASRVLLWDVDSGLLRATLEVGAPVRNLASSPDGRTLVVGTREGPGTPTQRILLWDAATAAIRTTLVTDLPASWQIVLAPDGQRLATVGRDGQVQIWGVATRTLERTIDARERLVRSLAFSPDGRLLAGGTVYGSVLLWDVETGAERPELSAGYRSIRLLAFSPDGKTLASGTLDDSLMLWDIPQGPEP